MFISCNSSKRHTFKLNMLNIAKVLSVFLVADVLRGPRIAAAVGGKPEDFSSGWTHMAIVNLTYVDLSTGLLRTVQEEMGIYAAESRLDEESGWVVHVRAADGTNDGCSPPVNAPPMEDKWIALVERGSCRSVLHDSTIHIISLVNLLSLLSRWKNI